MEEMDADVVGLGAGVESWSRGDGGATIPGPCQCWEVYRSLAMMNLFACGGLPLACSVGLFRALKPFPLQPFEISIRSATTFYIYIQIDFYIYIQIDDDKFSHICKTHPLMLNESIKYLLRILI